MTDSTYMSPDPDLTSPRPLIAAGIARSDLETLIKRWRKDADAYQAQVSEAREKELPCDQMVSAVTFLRACAKELESLLGD